MFSFPLKCISKIPQVKRWKIHTSIVSAATLSSYWDISLLNLIISIALFLVNSSSSRKATWKSPSGSFTSSPWEPQFLLSTPTSSTRGSMQLFRACQLCFHVAVAGMDYGPPCLLIHLVMCTFTPPPKEVSTLYTWLGASLLISCLLLF